METTLNKHGLLKKIKDIWAVETNISGENLKVSSPAEGDTELVAKAEIMTRYPKTKKIAIGDSITDINMALKADLVFARDILLEHLKRENKDCVPWNDFFDVRDYLQKDLK